MISLAAGVKWSNDVSGNVGGSGGGTAAPALRFSTIMSDLRRIEERAVSEERSVLVLAALQEAVDDVRASLTAVERETFTTTLMDLYNTAHSVSLRCSVLTTLTSLASSELCATLGYGLRHVPSSSATTLPQHSANTSSDGHSAVGRTRSANAPAAVSTKLPPLGSPSPGSGTAMGSPPPSSTGSGTTPGSTHGLLSADVGTPPHPSSSSSATRFVVPIWVSELHALLLLMVASPAAQSHLKQSVLSADSLTACALHCLDELLWAAPSLTAMCALQQRSRVAGGRAAAINQVGGGAVGASAGSGAGARSARDAPGRPTTEALQTIARMCNFLRSADVCHEFSVFSNAPPARRLGLADCGVRRLVVNHSSGPSTGYAAPRQQHAGQLLHTRGQAPAGPTTLASGLHEATIDVVEHLDAVPRYWLPLVVRTLALIWNYDGVSTPSTSAKVEKAVLQALHPIRWSKRRRPGDLLTSSPVLPQQSALVQAMEASWPLGEVFSMTSTIVLASGASAVARAMALLPSRFLPRSETAGPEEPIPSGYVLRSGPDGCGYYLDDPSSLPTGGTMPSDEVASAPLPMVLGCSAWWQDLSDAAQQGRSRLSRWASSLASTPPSDRAALMLMMLSTPTAVTEPLLRFPFLELDVVEGEGGFGNAGRRHLSMVGSSGASPMRRLPYAWPCHTRFDSPQILMLRFEASHVGSSTSSAPYGAVDEQLPLTGVEVGRVVWLLRHLRDCCWYLPPVRTVMALAIASLVTRFPESMVGPASTLLATCRAAAVLHTLSAVRVFETASRDDAVILDGIPTAASADAGLTSVTAASSHAFESHNNDHFGGAAPTTTSGAPPSGGHVSVYATLLSSVVHHTLLTEAPGRIAASFPVLLHAYGFEGCPLPRKLQLLDHLAVRIPEMPNTWYCGHHVVSCCRLFLISELRQALAIGGNDDQLIQLSSAALILLDVVLRHFSDLSVAQSAAMIRNALLHLPLDTVVLLLDVNSDDVQDVLNYCERPADSKHHDAAGAASIAMEIGATPVAKVTEADARRQAPLGGGTLFTLKLRISLRCRLPVETTGGPSPFRASVSGTSVTGLSDHAQSPPQVALVGGRVELYEAPDGVVERVVFADVAALKSFVEERRPVASILVTVLSPAQPVLEQDIELEVPDCTRRSLVPVYRSPTGRLMPVGGLGSAVEVPIPFCLYLLGAELLTDSSGAAVERQLQSANLFTSLAQLPDDKGVVADGDEWDEEGRRRERKGPPTLRAVIQRIARAAGSAGLLALSHGKPLPLRGAVKLTIVPSLFAVVSWENEATDDDDDDDEGEAYDAAHRKTNSVVVEANRSWLVRIDCNDRECLLHVEDLILS